MPLTLRVTVADADSCAPSSGTPPSTSGTATRRAYSGVQGDDGTFLRGIQVTDASGVATFQTVYPGW